MFVKLKAKRPRRTKCQDPFEKQAYRQSWYSFYQLWHPPHSLWHVIVLLHIELSFKKKEENGERAKMCLPDSSFPSTRSHVYKPALWILTQITLPTPTGMKTKPGEGIPARFLVGHRAVLYPQETAATASPSYLHCSLLPLRSNRCTDRWDV